MNCKICSNTTYKILRYKILSKYDIDLFKCDVCEFLMTEDPYWLNEAYEQSISTLDLGYVTRNLVYSNFCNSYFRLYRKGHDSEYLDYGGGYGLFTRLMRDKGYCFNNYDQFTKGFFSEPFNIKLLDTKSSFKIITSFEVFEHLNNPLAVINDIFSITEELIFSTELYPKISNSELLKWRYLLPQTGQHISFYSKKTLSTIAESLNAHLLTNGKDLHMITKNKYTINPIHICYYLNQIKDKLFNRNFLCRNSLLLTDYNTINQSSFENSN